MSAIGRGSLRLGSEAGATLLEMLVVMGLLALVTGVVYPNVRRPYETMKAVVARQALACDLRNARSEAIRESRPVIVKIEEDGRSYGWNDGRVFLPTALGLMATAPTIIFMADGSSSGGRLAVTQLNGRRYGVSVSSPTGVVYIEPDR